TCQAVTTGGGESELKVVLLGTMGGPSFSGERLGISTLVIAGDQMLLFDAGRSLTTGLARLKINPAGVTRGFLTHLHSDHIVALPELPLSRWASQGRTAPLKVGGPTGTRAMMERLQTIAFQDRRRPADKYRRFGTITPTVRRRDRSSSASSRGLPCSLTTMSILRPHSAWCARPTLAQWNSVRI